MGVHSGYVPSPNGHGKRQFINQPEAGRILYRAHASEIFLKEDNSMSEETQLTRLTLTRKEVAAYLGIHVNSVDRYKDIPRLRIGGRTLFRKETLDKYIADLEKVPCRKS
jgi:excisionase family DNA binding protein